MVDYIKYNYIVYWKCMKTVRSHNSYKNCHIIIAGKYDQLHILTNYPTKYESYQTNNLRGVAFTNITLLKLHENLKSPTTPTNIAESKWRDYRINQSWWPIILPNMKGIRLTNGQNTKLYARYYRMPGIKNIVFFW